MYEEQFLHQTGAGVLQGALCTIFSTTLAASIAYTFAQGLGRSFAKQMIDKEVGEASGKRDNPAQKASGSAGVLSAPSNS